MFSSTSVLLTVLAAQVIVVNGQAMYCFECNSGQDSGCKDPFESDDAHKFQKQCNTSFTSCKKSVVKVLGSTQAYIRECAPTEEGRDESVCQVHSNGDISCYCAGTLCNSATALHQAALLIGAAVSCTIFLKQLW